MDAQKAGDLALHFESGLTRTIGVHLRNEREEGLLLGMAMQAPLTTREDYAWQLVFQPDIEWGKRMK